MPRALDLLVALDDHLAANGLDYLIYGHELHGIAVTAGLCQPGSQQPAQWMGELVSQRYVAHGPLGFGDRLPLPRGYWTDSDLSRVSDYRLTYEGRTEADRVRRQRREQLTDAAMGLAPPRLLQRWMSEPQRRAVSDPLLRLRSALDAEHWTAAVGAAKELVEAACKVTIVHAGSQVSTNPNLPTLFKDAMRAAGIEGSYGEVGRSLAATVQRLSELRNTVGAGHGQASLPEVGGRAARLAAGAACAVALFLLDQG